MAQALATSVNRAGELAARYGGEEFAVLLPDADLARGPQVAQLICAAVRALGIDHAHTSAAPGVTVSIGMVCVQPVFNETMAVPASDKLLRGESSPVPTAVPNMLEQSDATSYNPRQAGRNGVAV